MTEQTLRHDRLDTLANDAARLAGAVHCLANLHLQDLSGLLADLAGLTAESAS